jgi:CRISP-associated protein Cas1
MPARSRRQGMGAMFQWSGLKLLWGRSAPLEMTPWLPSLPEDTVEDEPAISPVAAPLHVAAGSALIRADNGLLVVEREGEPRYERPIELVSAVHIHGWATITSGCVAELVRQGSPVIWRGATGYPIGLAGAMHQAGLEIRRAQYAAAGTPKGFAIARALVTAKIVNMRGLIRRRAALAGRDGLEGLKRQATRARDARAIESLLGIEGAATAQYFAAWPHLLTGRAGDLSLDTRTRRPPQDEVNALISYAYAVLAGECLTACAAAGLDARQGFLHRPRAGRAALALDLMEPFRPLIADQAVLNGLNNGQFKPEHFRSDGNAVLLTDDGRRLALRLIERRLLGNVTLDGRAEEVSWREAIGLSARTLADALRNGTRFVAMERAWHHALA